jgi:predicted transcriptional regulator
MQTPPVITEEHIDIAKYAKAISHPTRLYIVQNLLNRTECCRAGDLCYNLPIAKSTFSQHLKELKQAGVIQGETNPPNVKYCINRDNWNRIKMLFASVINQEQT